MVTRAVGNPYIKTTSPFGGTSRSFSGGSSTYRKTSSPLFGTSYSNSCYPSVHYSSPSSSPFHIFRRSSPTVIIHDDSPTVVHSHSRPANTGEVVIGGIFLTVIGALIVNALLTKREICQMVQDCDLITNTCGDLYEQCFPA